MMEDLINSKLADDLMIDIFRRIDSKFSSDSCCLVCKRWFFLERISRKTVQFGRSGRAESTDSMVRLLAGRFVNVENVYINELSVSSSSNLVKRRRVRRATPSTTSSLHESDQSVSGDNGMGTSCLSDSGMAAVGDGFVKLEKLSLIWCSSVTDVGLRSFAAKCKSLKSLDLQLVNGESLPPFSVLVRSMSGCYIGDEGLAAVGEYCNRLEDLNLRFCEGLTDIGLVQLALGCGRTLKSLGLAACVKVTDVSLEAVGSHCRSLETLSLDSDVINNKGMLAVAKGCRLLKVLKLQCVNITDEALEAVGLFCLSLELLALYSFQKFTDRSLYAIGNGCKRLKNLTLSDCYLLSNKSLDYVAAGCPELMHIEVNGCHSIGTDGLKSIGKINFHIDSDSWSWIIHRSRLSELALLYCQKIESNALSEIGEGCKFLQALHLVDCLGIGDDSICSIAKGCKNLKTLHIRRCYEVGNKGIIAVGQNCKFLTDLSIRFCDRVGDEALISIGQGCSLHILNVSGCHQIGDAGIIAIARGCPQLTSLDVSVLQHLGDRAMMELGEGCPLLKDVVISHCRKITDVGLGYLARKCTLLESCHMVYCPGITSAGVATVVTSCTRIKKVLVEKFKVSSRTKRRAGSIINYLCVEL
ncbi:hypothetical protein RD792_017246 [Penstemon davidsonii]|uniref:F-box/LRR-repeat protein 15-like leucin rich repeat domain-containing protein n=1 Tax=Penstemon davidsonii TaxID=160366 RepID=A0ABR0CNE4_9LAMI|nr:hypothetical protein RD792_017246 [Penstemon davidsonii]